MLVFDCRLKDHRVSIVDEICKSYSFGQYPISHQIHWIKCWKHLWYFLILFVDSAVCRFMGTEFKAHGLFFQVSTFEIYGTLGILSFCTGHIFNKLQSFDLPHFSWNSEFDPFLLRKQFLTSLTFQYSEAENHILDLNDNIRFQKVNQDYWPFQDLPYFVWILRNWNSHFLFLDSLYHHILKSHRYMNLAVSWLEVPSLCYISQIHGGFAWIDL